MTRMIAVTCLMTFAAACTGPGTTKSRVPYASTRHVPEPTTPGIHVSGHVIVGVSTVK